MGYWWLIALIWWHFALLVSSQRSYQISTHKRAIRGNFSVSIWRRFKQKICFTTSQFSSSVNWNWTVWSFMRGILSAQFTSTKQQITLCPNDNGIINKTVIYLTLFFSNTLHLPLPIWIHKHIVRRHRVRNSPAAAKARSEYLMITLTVANSIKSPILLANRSGTVQRCAKLSIHIPNLINIFTASLSSLFN